MVKTRIISFNQFKTISNCYIMQEEAVDKVEYTPYEQLKAPTAQAISQGIIRVGFQSKEWLVQFQTITSLRQANRYYSSIFINELLYVNAEHIVAQVDNLRSNNSKEALTLLSEVIQHQQLKAVDAKVIRPIVAALMTKSVSEKAFLKNLALKALNHLPKRWNQAALDELCHHTQSANGQICELAIRLVSEMLENNKDWHVDGKFLKSLSSNLNGKRSFVQKKAREILRGLKEREGELILQEKINSSTELLEQQSNTLRKELKQKQEKSKGQSLKDFIKSKKQQS